MLEPILVTQTSEHTCESAIYWNKSANLINEKCNFGYYHELTPEPRVLYAGDYLLLVGFPIPWTFFCTNKRQIPNPTEGSPYNYHKENTTMIVLTKCRTILPSG